MKILGSVMVMIACGGLGIDAAFRLKKRLCILEKLKQMVTHLNGEILYANAPLPEAFERVGNRNPGKAGDLFKSVASDLKKETGERFDQIWSGQVGKFSKESVLSRKEREQLIVFGEHLGYLDRDMQEKTIRFYLENLEYSIQCLRMQETEKCRLFVSLGILSGLFLTVVMV
ncbi:MAG: stage III sporulation protein AB [Lachnospiraceae bacterium]